MRTNPLYRTVIIPIQKRGNSYTLSVMKELWNDIQIMLLEGAKKDKIVLEFQIKEEKEK